MAPGPLADFLHDAVRRGDWSRVRERLAGDVVLRTSNEDGRRRVDGADAVVAHLARPGPGDVRLWDAQEWPTGVALSFEWEGRGGTDRRRWYFACLEALQNAIKHARDATGVWIALAGGDGTLRFEVRDDGVGFDERAQPPGVGLAGMRERLAAVGGTLEIASAPGGGTRVAGTVPAG